MRSVMLAMLRVLTVAAGAAKWETLWKGDCVEGSRALEVRCVEDFRVVEGSRCVVAQRPEASASCSVVTKE